MLRPPSSRIAGLALGLSACFVDSGGSGTSASATAGSTTADASSTGAGATSSTSDASAGSTGGSGDASVGSTGGSSDGSASDGSTSAPATSTDATTSRTTGSTTAPRPACGDGGLDPGEECDDGNMTAGDGCSPACLREWHYVFVSSEAFDGDLGGLDGADAKCQLLADNAGLAGTFRAWLSTPGGSPSTRFTKWHDRYVRPDGTPVAFDYDDLVDGGPLLAPITVTEEGKMIGGDTCNTGGVWTATSTAGDFLGEHCGGWVSASKLVGGAKGLVSSVTLWTEASCAGPCEGFGRLYCFEQ